MKRLLPFLILLLVPVFSVRAQQTYLVAQRDTCDLFMDVYQPDAEASLLPDGTHRPTIVYVFGGGFIMGSRNDKYVIPWFQLLAENGYRVVSVDYRLGLKGVPMRFDLFHLLSSAKKTKTAVDMGVEDVFASVRFLIDNAQELGVDPDRIVLAGSSAGAMISLSCEWEACNRTVRAEVLPEDFHFAGVMSFAGAIMSDQGIPSYRREPCPQLLFHGTKDGAVAYDKMSFGKWGMFGSSSLVSRSLQPKGYVYQIFRYKDHSHDMAANMMATWPQQKYFLETNVIGGYRCIIDAMVDDPTIPVWESVTLDDIY